MEYCSEACGSTTGFLTVLATVLSVISCSTNLFLAWPINLRTVLSDFPSELMMSPMLAPWSRTDRASRSFVERSSITKCSCLTRATISAAVGSGYFRPEGELVAASPRVRLLFAAVCFSICSERYLQVAARGHPILPAGISRYVRLRRSFGRPTTQHLRGRFVV